MSLLARRHVLGLGALALTAGAPHARAAPRRGGSRPARLEPAQYSWDAPPPMTAARSGFAPAPGARLWFWDTGGAGETIVLLHPATGSADVWAYQQAAFVRAGYRVVAYSRRGHGKSDAGPTSDVGTGAGDLRALATHLGLTRFHLLGTAAGGFIAPDYALSYPDTLLSLTIACSQGGVIDPAYRAVSEAIRPDGWSALPADFRELGPSYRAANPQGAALWAALEHAARHTRITQGFLNRLTWDALGRMRVPTLLLGGSADLLMPPSRLLDYARHVPGAEAAVISEAGHSAYWEQPLAFNRLVLDFIGRHGHVARSSKP